MKAVVIGNSGSGKTWFAQQLASRKNAVVIHLDDLYWSPDGFNTKRNPEETQCMLRETLSYPRFVAEGVFGALAREFFPVATQLFWLDLPWSICKERLFQRGSESTRHLGREQSEAGLRELIEWAGKYEERNDTQSRIGHEKLFNEFGGSRFRLLSEKAVGKYLGEA